LITQFNIHEKETSVSNIAAADDDASSEAF
jgi:hypothetical protein